MVHDHAFSTWTSDLPRQALAVSDPRIEHEAGSWRVAFSLTNRGAGHRIPTGAFGDRALRTTLDLLGDADRIVGHAEAALLAAKDEGLVPFRPTPFTLEVDVAPEDAVRVVRLRVYTTDEHRSFVFLLEERRWPVPASPDGS
jgi:hypothetical protein